MRGDFARKYWAYKKNGGKLGMKEYANMMKNGGQNEKRKQESQLL